MDQVDTPVYITATVQTDDEVYVKGRRRFQVYVIFQGLFDDVTEVTAFGAVAIPVLALVMLVFHRTVKPVLSLFDLVPDLG